MKQVATRAATTIVGDDSLDKGGYVCSIFLFFPSFDDSSRIKMKGKNLRQVTR
jgi:hypothetical protein